jgi:hypothetical protein
LGKSSIFSNAIDIDFEQLRRKMQKENIPLEIESFTRGQEP